MIIGTKRYHTDKYWNELNLDPYSQINWEKAIALFEDRITGRFFQHLEILQKDPSIKNSCGFVVLAIDCLLIETLNQFYHGIEDTNKKYSGMNAMAFHDLFQESPVFSKFFDSEKKSKVFYHTIRCGILHQAQTKQKSLIKSSKSRPILEWVNKVKIEDGIIVNRIGFHDEICRMFETYKMRLMDGNEIKLRKKFIKKMDSICST